MRQRSQVDRDRLSQDGDHSVGRVLERDLKTDLDLILIKKIGVAPTGNTGPAPARRCHLRATVPRDQVALAVRGQLNVPADYSTVTSSSLGKASLRMKEVRKVRLAWAGELTTDPEGGNVWWPNRGLQSGHGQP
jgi:hypothetical protein